MKRIITLIVVLLASLSGQKSFSQVTYPCGVYFIGMDGTSDYGLWDQAFNSADITLATWVQITDSSSVGKRMAIFSRYDYNVENENTDFSLVLNEAGEFEFTALVLGSGGQVQDNLPFGFKPTVGVWYHIAVTFNGTSHQCNEYVNGNLTASKSFAGPLSYVIVGSAFSKTISFGARYYPQNSGIVNTYFKGYFDEAVYASKELSADAIKTLAVGVAAGNSFIADNSIVIYHKFDDYPGQPNYGVSGGTLPTNGQYYYCPAQYNPPVANAGPDQTITLPVNTVTLSGSATPGTGTIVSGVWSKESGPAGGDISDPNSQTPVITNLQEGTYVFKLTITDDKGETGTDEVSIIVKKNQPPVANAGDDKTIFLPETESALDGSTSNDPDGTISSIMWTQEDGPNQANITDPESLVTDINGLVEGTYTFHLTITDDQLASASDDVIITLRRETKDTTIYKCPGFYTDISGLVHIQDYLNVLWLTSNGVDNIDPTNVDTGEYLLLATVDNHFFDTTFIDVNDRPEPDLGEDLTQTFCPATYVDESHLFDPVFTAHPNYIKVGWFTLSGIPVDPTLVPFETVQLVAKNEFGCLDTVSVEPEAYPIRNIVPASPQALIANRETTPDADGWVDYYYDYIDNMGINKNFLLLSLNTGDNNDIGHIGDGKFQVKVVATAGAGSGNPIKLTNPLITNPSGTYVMNRYWTVTANPEPQFSVGVRFYYNNADFDDVKSSLPYLTDANSPADNEKMIFYKSDGGNPDPTSNLAGATSLRTISSGDVADPDTWVFTALGCGENQAEFEVESFSGGGGGGTVNELPLPLLLKNFSAIPGSNNVLLNWQTAQEINASYFIIERSSNGTDFSSIGKVGASGNSSTIKNYSYIDSKPNNGINYYRLKMVDADGKFTYSKVVVVKNDNNESSFRIFPNPAQEILYVQASGSNDFTTLQIFDAGGRKLKEEKVVLNGNTSYSINIKNLPKGVYNLLLKSKTVNEHQKFVKQ